MHGAAKFFQKPTAEKPEAGVKREHGDMNVPIREILKAESKALWLSTEEQTEAEKAYKHHVKRLKKSLKLWMRANGIKDINEADERCLFEFLSAVLYEDLKASYDPRKVVTTSMITNAFNCYSSS